ncbi:holin [Gordonia phage Ashertheman]|uniref:Holin n=6 Tax=Kroosvirus TaxID=2948789 RepID=A0A3G3M8C5_9CAUD|nr:hypothetical protein J1761_gp43 [Gordonia phage Kroos]YP_010001836.1 holin [Gordonia phage Ashertheman]YP_010001920.1 hypothetical protein J1765_gp42 [Gordonia phage Gaea]YP_010002007.1 hypothetical protein J1766_gp43 [Gordonia phage Bizzy]YP_010002091.1 holin [Gordonia phage Tangerine]YP_010002177.1 hypothetical protein J1768_gp43 [Gordonia phage Ribeye]UAJ15710.1 holin [Gordonia phage Baddon]UTN91696.1 holin [Gordonia Phage StorminNorm]WMI33052.1 membrane protein [Gordonia Phage Schott
MTHRDPLTGVVAESPAAGSPFTFGGFVADVAEKTSKTFAQNLLLFLTLGVSITAVPWTTALQGATIAAVSTAGLAVVQSAWTAPNQYVETFARAGRTFIATGIGALPVVSPDHVLTFADVNLAELAGVAGTAAAVSLLTSVASWKLGADKASPSLVR